MSELSSTADEIVTEFLFSAPISKTWVLVEGESDVAFLWEYRTEDECVLIDMQGKSQITEALSSHVIRGQPGIVGIVDADYWIINQSPNLSIDNVLCDAEHPDMEVLLFSSPALRKSLRHDIRRLPDVTVPVVQIESFADLLATKAFCLGMEIGYFRLLNEFENYGISFSCFWQAHRLEEFVVGPDRTFDFDWFARRLADHHKTKWTEKPDRWIPYDELLDGVDELKERYPMPDKRLCRGKDVIAAAELIGPNLLESEFSSQLSTEQLSLIDFDDLSTELRKCYEYIYFMETSLHERIIVWQDANPGFRIIRDLPAQSA